MKCRFLVCLLLLVACSDNHFVQRAASDYFPLEQGNIWYYAQDSDTIVVEVELPDTLLNRECYPVSFGGYTHWLAKTSDAVDEYVKIVYFFSGDEYTILEDYAMRMELPLVADNTWQDSLVDSLEISGQWITAKYYVDGEVIGYFYDDNYEADVYGCAVTTTTVLITTDTVMTETNFYEETYAPEIGLIDFDRGDGTYILVDYIIQ
jgi:hypothetical protein